MRSLEKLFFRLTLKQNRTNIAGDSRPIFGIVKAFGRKQVFRWPNHPCAFF